MSEILVGTEEEFDALDTESFKPLLVLFTAPAWCQPCRQFEPHWERAQKDERTEVFQFVKVDMGETPENTGSHWATERFGIMGVPSVKVIDGEGAAPVDIKARAVVPLIRELTGG